MLAKNSADSAPAASKCRVWEIDQLGGEVNFLATPLLKPPQAIRAELIGSDLCTAAGYVARGTAPILAMCRKLVAAGAAAGL